MSATRALAQIASKPMGDCFAKDICVKGRGVWTCCLWLFSYSSCLFTFGDFLFLALLKDVFFPGFPGFGLPVFWFLQRRKY